MCAWDNWWVLQGELWRWEGQCLLALPLSADWIGHRKDRSGMEPPVAGHVVLEGCYQMGVYCPTEAPLITDCACVIQEPVSHKVFSKALVGPECSGSSHYRR